MHTQYIALQYIVVWFTATEYPSASACLCHLLKLSLNHTMLSVSTPHCTYAQCIALQYIVVLSSLPQTSTFSTSLCGIHCHRHPPTVHRCVEFTATEYPSASARLCHLLKLSLNDTMLSVSTSLQRITVHRCFEFTATDIHLQYIVVWNSLPLNIHPPLLVLVIT